MAMENPKNFVTNEPHLTLVHSVETPEEPTSALRPLGDSSLTSEAISASIDTLLRTSIRPEDLRKAEDSLTHPQLIIRSLFEELGYSPDLDEMRESSLEKGGKPSDHEKTVLRDALRVEALLNEAIERLEYEQEQKNLHQFVELIDDYATEHHSDASITEALDVLASRITGRNDRLRATMAVTKRIILTMLYLKDNPSQLQ